MGITKRILEQAQSGLSRLTSLVIVDDEPLSHVDSAALQTELTARKAARVGIPTERIGALMVAVALVVGLPLLAAHDGPGVGAHDVALVVGGSLELETAIAELLLNAIDNAEPARGEDHDA